MRSVVVNSQKQIRLFTWFAPVMLSCSDYKHRKGKELDAVTVAVLPTAYGIYIYIYGMIYIMPMIYVYTHTYL